MFEGKYSLGGPIESPSQAVARRGCGTGWEGHLPDVPLALGGAVAGRKPEWGEGAWLCSFPQKSPKGLLAEGRVWNVLLLILRAIVHWGFMVISPLGLVLLFHVRLCVNYHLWKAEKVPTPARGG